MMNQNHDRLTSHDSLDNYIIIKSLRLSYSVCVHVVPLSVVQNRAPFASLAAARHLVLSSLQLMLLHPAAGWPLFSA
jgi:hypothetical protein